MRFYPFGSSSLNIIYNLQSTLTSSITQYATTASYGLSVVSASHALAGRPGTNGTDGVCTYVVGASGSVGDVGDAGPNGTVSNPLFKP